MRAPRVELLSPLRLRRHPNALRLKASMTNGPSTLHVWGAAGRTHTLEEDRVALKAQDSANKGCVPLRRSGEVSSVTIRVRPAPDAQERLRRVFSLILAAALRAESGGTREEVVDDPMDLC